VGGLVIAGFGPAGGGGAALDLMRALRALPPDARRFAATRVAWLVLADDLRGCAIPPARLGGDRWLIALRGDASALPALVGHELAHAMVAHEQSTEETEREAAQMAASWSLDGPASDADGCVAALDLAERRAPRFRTRRIGNTVVALTCSRCGGDCSVLAAPVRGLRAGLVAAECSACASAGAVWLDAMLTCRTCAAPMFATWLDGTDDAPRFTAECSACGETAALTLKCEAATRRPTPSGAVLREAARLLLGAEESLRRADSDTDELTQSSVVATLALALRRIRTGAALLGDDPRVSLVNDAAADTETGWRLVAGGDFTGAAERLAVASGALDALAGATR
jgi:hypothetical protein